MRAWKGYGTCVHICILTRINLTLIIKKNKCEIPKEWREKGKFAVKNVRIICYKTNSSRWKMMNDEWMHKQSNEFLFK